MAGVLFDLTASVKNMDGVNAKDMKLSALWGAVFALVVVAWPGVRLKLTAPLFIRLVERFLSPDAGPDMHEDVAFTAGQTQDVRVGLVLPFVDARARDGQLDTAQPTELVEGRQLQLTFGGGVFGDFAVQSAVVRFTALELPGNGKVAPAILDVGFESYAGSKLQLTPGSYSDLFVFDGWSGINLASMPTATVEVDGGARYVSQDTEQLVQLASHFQWVDGFSSGSPLDLPLLAPGGRDYVTTQLPLAERGLAVEVAGATGKAIGWIRRTPRTPGDAEEARRALGAATGVGHPKVPGGELSPQAAPYAAVLPYRMED